MVQIPGFGGRRWDTPRRFMKSQFSLSPHERHITPNNAANDTQRHLYCCRGAVFLVFRSLIGTLVAPLDVFVNDLGLHILQSSSNPGLQALRLRVKLQPLIEGLDGPLLLAKYRALREARQRDRTFPRGPVRQDFDYRASGEAVPGLEGSNTGLRGKQYRASGEEMPGFGGNSCSVFPANTVLFQKTVRSLFEECLKICCCVVKQTREIRGAK